ncbi:hypothetical protein ACF07S_02495 [Streptomyces sp. NPDC016640]|uniref:hypothetical protein n=1 Tax=Streptomyces sp. NPDC016640 TaxID=3364969 RepID=UPI0036F65ADD
MADEQYRWLDRETAERLLGGEPPEAAEPVARDQARRLAATLRALSSPLSADGGELPGEAAALAAFRKLREERDGPAAGDTGAGHHAGTRPPELGPVRIGAPGGDRSGDGGGPRRMRPLHLGLAAALAVGMAGGVAVLAGTGVLPMPSDGSRSDPAASVTATGTHPERPPLSPSPTTGAAPGDRHPEGAAGTAGSRDGGDAGADGGDPATRSGRGKQLASACRAWRDGEGPHGERRRLLEDAAGGPSRVADYCAGVPAAGDTAGTGSTAGTDTDEGASPGNGNGGGTGNSSGNGNGTGASGNGGGNNNSDKGAQGSSQGNQGSRGNQGNAGGQGNQGQGKQGGKA